ncbi:putative lipid II flippase FtsW [Patescibacteria group bacterium]
MKTKGKSPLKKQKKSVDRSLMILFFVFTILGLVAVADASAPQALSVFNDKLYFFKQQAVWAGVGIILLLIFSKINYKLWEKVATIFFLISLGLLVAVLVPGIGLKALGARRWIPLGFFSIQPSEIVKLSLAVYLAKVASKEKSTLSYFIPLVIVSFLIMLEPDLGTTVSITLFALAQIFISGVNIFQFFLACLGGILAAIVLIITSSYRRERLITYLNATQDPLGKSYHIRQILLALGSGGIFGVGIGASRQKFLFLPEAATDSIFAVIAEELGFVGAAVVIILFAFFLYKGLSISMKSPDIFSQVLAVGLTVWIGGQAFLNIASMVALIPLTGIPLPFFSYGGSSLVMILVACGILLNISKYAETKKSSFRR